MIIPSIWENKKCSKPPTRYILLLHLSTKDGTAKPAVLSQHAGRSISNGPWCFRISTKFSMAKLYLKKTGHVWTRDTPFTIILEETTAAEIIFLTCQQSFIQPISRHYLDWFLPSETVGSEPNSLGPRKEASKPRRLIARLLVLIHPNGSLGFIVIEKG